LGLGGPGAAIGPDGRPVDPLVTTGMIRRAEVRKHLRVAQQLKVATLVVVALLLLAAYPIYLFTRSATSDPVFGDLDSLNLPSWAAIDHKDAASGNRWCIDACRFRTRTWASERKADETNTVYETALRNAGWRPRAQGVCPPVAEGTASCWQRDEYVLDMWIRAPICDIAPPRPTIGADPSASAAPDPNAGPPPATCPGALVTVQVFNAIDYGNPVN
jgi:integrin beta 3